MACKWKGKKEDSEENQPEKKVCEGENGILCSSICLSQNLALRNRILYQSLLYDTLLVYTPSMNLHAQHDSHLSILHQLF